MREATIAGAVVLRARHTRILSHSVLAGRSRKYYFQIVLKSVLYLTIVVKYE